MVLLLRRRKQHCEQKHLPLILLLPYLMASRWWCGVWGPCEGS